MRVAHIIAGLSVVLVTGGVAHAAGAKPDVYVAPSITAAITSEAPWFQRFTYSAAVAEGARAGGLRTNQLTPDAHTTLNWAASPRWGVTVDMRSMDAAKFSSPSEATTIGAYYRFTPNLRLGGEVSLADRPSNAAPIDHPDSGAGVKLESAFRF